MSDLKTIIVSSFYRFQPLTSEQVKTFQQKFQAVGDTLGLRGLFLISTEGVNATVAGEPEALDDFKIFVQIALGDDPLFFKESTTNKNPFRKMLVKIREEIVTLGRPDLVPYEKNNGHISPEEWHLWLDREDVTVIDTRNDYEVELGKFKNAIDFNIQEFQEFPEKVKAAGLDKDKPVLIYCTGGIRCEKAILEMQEQGFTQVKQLNGGILNYLEKFPEGHWNGECFVFDYRVAVDSHLKPSSKFSLCPHCGQPGATLTICPQCGIEEKICEKCLPLGKEYETCSKNCFHHFTKGHKTTRLHLDGMRRRNIE